MVSHLHLCSMSVEKDKIATTGTLFYLIKDSVCASVETSTKALAVRIGTDAMTLGGILPNDILICEPLGKQPPKGNMIIAYYEGAVATAGRFFDPFIIPASSNGEHRPVKIDSVQVIGRVVQQIRIL
jgi:SOS-response transcriptional repressor LexA